MSEMIERMAAAMWQAINPEIPWLSLYEHGELKALARLEARAAIKALRYPTEAMKDALSEALSLWINEHGTDEDVFFAVLDAALSTVSNSLPTPAATPTDSANPPPVESVGPNSGEVAQAEAAGQGSAPVQVSNPALATNSEAQS